MLPIVINGQSIEEINQSTQAIRQNCKDFLPAIRLRLYTEKGHNVQNYNNIKSYMFHKRGMLVIGINRWRKMPFLLKKLRELLPDVRILALIHRHNYQGIDVQVCMAELHKYNIDNQLVDTWAGVSDVLNDYSPNVFQFGLQSTGYIAMLQGNWQIYNKVPGYTYPAKNMIA